MSGLAHGELLIPRRSAGDPLPSVVSSKELTVKTIARVLFVVLGVSLLAGPGRPLLERAWFVYTLSTEEPAAVLHAPIMANRAVRFIDSWGNSRSGGRRHEGIDIFAAKDTPVLSTTRGIVMRVGTSRLGGQVVWILGPGFERHYYAHLNRYATFRSGDRVEAGEIIGYTGNTGNARGGRSHLHYGIYRSGAAQNPYPRLVARDSAPTSSRLLSRPRVKS
jgi:peptidoglycan LD-endopeptidase LytH